MCGYKIKTGRNKSVPEDEIHFVLICPVYTGEKHIYYVQLAIYR